MSLSRNILDREHAKFQATAQGETAVRIVTVGGIEPPPSFDAITVEYPSGNTEVYRYREGGVTGTVLMTITVIYTSPAKASIASVARS